MTKIQHHPGKQKQGKGHQQQNLNLVYKIVVWNKLI